MVGLGVSPLYGNIRDIEFLSFGNLFQKIQHFITKRGGTGTILHTIATLAETKQRESLHHHIHFVVNETDLLK